MKQQIERIALSNQQNDGVIEPMQLVTQPQPQYQYSQQQEYYEYGEDEYSYEEDEANANNTQEDSLHISIVYRISESAVIKCHVHPSLCSDPIQLAGEFFQQVS